MYEGRTPQFPVAMMFTVEKIQLKFETKCCITFYFVGILDTPYLYYITFMIQDFDEVEFLECIKELIRVDREWVPKINNCSLYLRPTFIGTEV